MTGLTATQPEQLPPPPHRASGKERDAESGNDYFGARYYSSAMGRFLSPDWSAKEEPVPYSKLDNPQTLNLYDYMRSNPLAGVDADGHCPMCIPALAGGGGLAGGLAADGGITAALASNPIGWGVAAVVVVGGGAYLLYEHYHQDAPAPAATPAPAEAPVPATPTPGAIPAVPAGAAPAPTTTPASSTQPKSNPLTGKPGSTSQTNKPDGSPKQVRRYGSDGYPETDVDHDSHGGKTNPHAHDWGRPADGSAPTAKDRPHAGRPVKPTDPKPQ